MKEAFVDIRKQLEKKLKKDRFEHTIGVMYTAASLAMRYHEDIDDAMMAGLLHDCGKYGSVQEQVERCQKHGILLTQSELEMPALVHAKLGAYFAEKVVFAMLIGIISCREGMATVDGAVGVGRSTMRAMVYSAVSLLVANFLLTMVLNQIFPMGFMR